jgi:hypothetical protein
MRRGAIRQGRGTAKKARRRANLRGKKTAPFFYYTVKKGENTMLVRANSAKVDCDPKTKKWHVHIQVGAEVIKRPLSKCAEESGDEVLRAEAVETAKAEGYEVDPTQVEIARV